jgi:hypothetical protein
LLSSVLCFAYSLCFSPSPVEFFVSFEHVGKNERFSVCQQEEKYLIQIYWRSTEKKRRKKEKGKKRGKKKRERKKEERKKEKEKSRKTHERP